MRKNKLLLGRKESGQIIVLLAVSLVVVLMVAALAVDGGMIYSERRFAQNAADASSMAGGGTVLYSINPEGFVCPGSGTSGFNYSTLEFDDETTLIAKTYFSALNVSRINNINDLPFLGYKVNGTFENESLVNEKHGVIIECDSSNEPAIIDISTIVTSQISTAFAHLIYPGALATTNIATTRVEVYTDDGYGPAIVALSPNCNHGNIKGGLHIGGSSDVNIINGSAYTRSCLNINGAGKNEQLTISATGGLNVFDEDVTIQGTFSKIAEFEAIINTGYGELPFTPPDAPICPEGNIKSYGVINKDTNLTKGNYDQIKITGGDVNFGPGVYCIDGNFDIGGNGIITGKDVTFYIKNGLLSINGGGGSEKNSAVVLLSAPTSESDPNFGVLFYFDESNTNENTFNGNNDSYFSGMVYVPKGVINIGGSADMETMDEAQCEAITEDGSCEGSVFSTQFIGWEVNIVGGGNIDITYNKQLDPNSQKRMFLKD